MNLQPKPTLTPRPRGFSLIELMVVVAIGAILVGVALPMYQDSARKSRRSDAFVAVAAIQQSQERWRANNPAYSTSLTDLRVTEPGLYGLTISTPGADASALASGYVVVADGRGAQADDRCAKLGLRVVNGNITYAGGPSGSTLTYGATHACWAR